MSPNGGGSTDRTGTLEQQPEVVALMKQRLNAQPSRSLREAKRLLNVWQLYQRVLDLTFSQVSADAAVERTCHLIILAEIVTRWPALQPMLHQRAEGRSGLQRLAAASNDDELWKNALSAVGIDETRHHVAVGHLRDLLRTYEGRAVAGLAAIVL